MIDGLGGIAQKDGTVALVCGEFKVSPEHALGAQNNGEAAYLLVCPSCKKFLGEWTTIQYRDSELEAFKNHVKQSS
jgi:hypothetical protein